MTQLHRLAVEAIESDQELPADADPNLVLLVARARDARAAGLDVHLAMRMAELEVINIRNSGEKPIDRPWEHV